MSIHYEIVVEGGLGPRLAGAIEGFEAIATEEGTTRLVGWVRDQSDLQGKLRRVSDLGLELVSVARLAD
ncbi:MAG: hypothetical protein ACE367_23115 [Acidimicrobiales bacterium]